MRWAVAGADEGGHRCAFVLGGGGALGAYEVGMLKALLEAGYRPDLVVGASVGAVNGAVVAADPSVRAVGRLAELWTGLGRAGVFSAPLWRRVGTAARSRTHLYSHEPLRRMLEEDLPGVPMESLAVPFQCVAACIEEASEHWFTEGPVVPAVLASSAVPGLLPPVRIGDRHFLDGGLVNSIPVGRAVALGAREVFVLQVGRVEQALQPPRHPAEVAAVAFEIARRHRFARDMSDLPGSVAVHVLPTGAAGQARPGSRGWWRHQTFAAAEERIERAYRASLGYLETLAESGTGAAGAPGAPGAPGADRGGA
ncbi:patatin-like phospholipase family protein [Phaeacidiphilus oryzae]|uniref:patatin-like phospholipase family protein n=1 Tax=Phaeacidiphilus oryzae TaxID=348818 RepID=UPI00068E6E36|nr:patatin-like phospholipase family protein [Phaeacidiphilus oryzae]